MQGRIPVIAAALLPFPATLPGGTRVQDASGDAWLAVLRVVAAAGFKAVDLTDSWLRPGDLTSSRRNELSQALDQAGLQAAAISVIRRSVIDPEHADENLAYSHATIDAAAELGIALVSLGLHRPLLPAQQQALWFWTANGPRDADDPDTWNAAVHRIQDLGRHAASVGVRLSLEMYEDTLIGTADGAVRLVTEVDHPNVGLNPDLGNLYRLHRPIEPFLTALAKCLPYTNYWHVKSYLRDEDPQSGQITTLPAPMELGSMDYRTALTMAHEAGFDGPYCVEHYGGDGLSAAARNRDYIIRIFHEHGWTGPATHAAVDEDQR